MAPEVIKQSAYAACIPAHEHPHTEAPAHCGTRTLRHMFTHAQAF